MSQFTDAVVKHARSELDRWGGGTGRETDDPYSGYVAEYWKAGVGNNNVNGKTTYQNSKGKAYRPAWSSVFVSFIYRKAGAGAHFHYDDGHIHYIVKCLRDAAAGQGKFRGRNPSLYAPKPGDLISEGRDWAKKVTYQDVLSQYGSKAIPGGNFIPTHSDIVVSVDRAAKKLVTIGGNVATDTTGAKTWRLNDDGTLRKGDQMICAVECLL